MTSANGFKRVEGERALCVDLSGFISARSSIRDEGYSKHR